MISKHNRILNALQATVYIDSKDTTTYRISMDNVFKLFAENDIVVPPRQYEETLEKVLNERIAGKVNVTSATSFVIAQAMYNLAQELAISKNDIIKYNLENNR